MELSKQPSLSFDENRARNIWSECMLARAIYFVISIVPETDSGLCQVSVA